jgi:excinuclease ABC subunit C
MDSETHPLKGAERIAAYLKTLPDQPGVYRMLNAAGDVLYVGKAKSLKKRVSAYARGGVHADRLTRMVAETTEMLFVTTASETEALLLESNLIATTKAFPISCCAKTIRFHNCSSIVAPNRPREFILDLSPAPVR